MLGLLFDLSGLRESDLGEHRADQLIHEGGEQRNGHDLGSYAGKILACSNHLRHTDCYTGLGKQRDTEIFTDLRRTFRSFCAEI